jgi:outer membrane protein assembly factor BamB
MKYQLAGLLSFLILFTTGFSVYGDDWPMWRYDSNRSGNSPEQLADELYLQWQIEYSPREPVWDDPLNQDLMKFDRIFEPVVAGNKLFIGFNDQDKVVALDIHSGKELWSFYTDGPVRLPLAVNKGKLFFTGDDGYCYCLDSESGALVWKRLLAPSENKLLGNKRLISMWPARGGIVIKDDMLYTAASIFPLMGTFIYALDAATGDIIWKNEGTGSNYILQPHNSPAFAHVAPQGAFTISGDKLLVAGGRSVPAAFDLKTGEELYYQLAASGKTGGAFTFASEKVFFNHHRERVTWMYDSDTGERISTAGEYPVIDGNTFYFSGKKIWAAQLDADKKLDTLWISDIPATNDLIKAGDCLFAADSSGVKALKLSPGQMPEVSWSFGTEKNVERLVAANGKLIAVTSEGTIMVFGEEPVETVKHTAGKTPAVYTETGKSQNIIQATGIDEGYGLVFGGKDVKLIEGLLAGSSLNLVVYEKDQERIQYLREYFDKAGITAGRVSFQHFVGPFPPLPNYFSSLTLVTDPFYIGHGDKDILEQIYETTRPYGGKIVLNFKRKERNRLMKGFGGLNLPGLLVLKENGITMISRTGPLQGASPWTHNNGNIANTVKSDDQLVRAPLGILWFGGNSNMDVLPRHGHGPGEQVIDGRLIIQGINSISARDVYTGRVLWKREFEQLMDDNWMVFYDETYDEENPLDPKYNQVHLPGANARGTNYIATKEYVYLIEGNRCNVIDIRNGDIVKVFETGEDNTLEFGYIGVYDDLLILGNNFAEFTGLENDSIRIKNPKFTDYNLTASRELMVLNRFSGEKLWSIEANHGFIHNSVIAGDGMLFCLDKLPQYLETKLRRRGEEQPEGSRLLYLDVSTGNVISEETEDIFGTWLGYSSEYKLLLQSTRPSRDMLNGEEGKRMIAYNIGTKEKIWDKAIKYANPPIIHNDKIYTNGEGFWLLTGDPLTETDPVTGEELKWGFKREYGCGFVAASEHLLTFRSASAGFVNLNAFEGTGSLGGWKPGCSTNLIAADGVLNSPDYTRTCHCAYQNQTSLALINMPWMSYWTNSNYRWNGNPIKQLGLNFNAPGDRSSDDDVLWFEYPYVSGAPPEIPVNIDPSGITKIRKEPFSVISEKTPWVSSSALCGIRSLEITLAKDQTVPESTYTVKLYFSELENKKPGERVFDISIQDTKVAEGFDIVAEAGKPDKEVVKQYHGIKAGQSLKLDLVPVRGNTIISGIELIQESLTVQ